MELGRLFEVSQESELSRDGSDLARPSLVIAVLFSGIAALLESEGEAIAAMLAVHAPSGCVGMALAPGRRTAIHP